jgi:predicted O-methyltransferase YrrM
MDDRLIRLVIDLHRRGRDHDAAQADRLNRYRNLEPDSAQLLALLVRALAPGRLLELGTSNGYSTIWLADAARDVGGALTTVELDPERAAEARANLAAAQLDQLVELRVADAGGVLSESSDATWGFIFLDAERPAYVDYWSDLVRSLAPRGLLAVDNVISHADELTAFRDLVAGDARVDEALVPTGAGMLLVVKRGE